MTMEAGTMEFGPVMKEVRVRRGLSLEALAVQIGGTHAGYLESIETGAVKTLAWDFLARMATALEVSVKGWHALAYATRAPIEVRRIMLDAVWQRHAKGNWRP